MILYGSFSRIFLNSTANTMINHANYPTLQSILKVFYLLVVQFESENTEVRGVCIKCTN